MTLQFMRTTARLSFWLLTAIVLFFALVPGSLGTIIASDMSRHYLAFLALPALAHFAWPRLPIILLWSAFVAFGGLIEILQQVMDLGRAAEMADWINDINATTISLLAAYVAVRFLNMGEQTA